MTNPPHLFVAIPGAGYVHSKAYYAHLGVLGCTGRYWERTYGKEAKTTLLVTDRMAVDKARNLLAKKALQLEADWIFWMDDDMDPPPNIIERLMAVGAPMSSAVCSKRCLPPEAMAYTWFDGGFHRFIAKEWPDRMEVDAVGMACVLMNRAVLEHVWNETNGRPFQYANGKYGTEDLYFFELAKKGGFSLVMDGTISVGHLGIHDFRMVEKDRTGVEVNVGASPQY